MGLLATALILFSTLGATTPSLAERPVRIVALGDSLTAGYNLPASSAFPNQLEAALRRSGEIVEVINAGVSGDTTSGALERLDWAVDDNVDIVLVELGANDMLRGIAPALVRKNLDQILTILARKKTRVLLAGMLAAPGLGSAYASDFNAIYPDLARQHGIALYPFFLDGVAADPALLLKDGMHPNHAGVERIVQNILPSIRKLIAEARAGRQ